MVFAESDIKRCMGIVLKLLKDKNNDINDAVLRRIAIDILNISYSKGGSYTEEVINSFAQTYVEKDFHVKFIL